MYKDLGMNSVRFNDLLENVDHFVLKDIFRIAALIEIDEKVILEFIYMHYNDNRSSRKKVKGT